MNRETIELAKAEVKKDIEADARKRAASRMANICRKRGGKFKISAAQFMKEMEDAWVCGEFSAAERVLRVIEMDPELNTKDLIRGEIHLMIMERYEILKKRLQLKEELLIEDLLWDRYTTDKVMESFQARSENAN